MNEPKLSEPQWRLLRRCTGRMTANFRWDTATVLEREGLITISFDAALGDQCRITPLGLEAKRASRRT